MIYNILIIGAGGIGKRHIKGYLGTSRAKISIVEPDVNKQKNLNSEFEIQHKFNSLDEVNQKFDLAIICSPANWHLEHMQFCIKNNLSFMVEKPLSTKIDGLENIIEEVREKKLFVRVGYTRRNSLVSRALKNQIMNNKIGEVKLAYINSSQEFPKYRPDYQTIYYAKEETGGGAILDASTHMIDQLIWILGIPEEVGCMYDRLVLEGTETEDTCLINIKFSNGCLANITVNQFQKPNINTYEFVGTKGNIKLDHSTLMFADDDSGVWKDQKDYMKGQDPMEVHQNNFLLQANRFLDGYEGKDCDLATLEEAYLNLKVVLAAKLSWQDKKIIKIS